MLLIALAACSVDERSLGEQESGPLDAAGEAAPEHNARGPDEAGNSADALETSALVDVGNAAEAVASLESGGPDAPLASDAMAADDSASDGGDGAIVANPLRDGCKLLLHIEEPAWSGVAGEAIDSSGFGNHGTANGTATTTADGKFGRAGSFDGSGWVTVHDAPSLRPTTAVTYAAWIYPTGLDGVRSPGIIAKRTGFGMDTAFTMFIWINNQLYVDIESENNRFASPTVFQNNQWYFVAVVFDGSLVAAQRVRVYVNGGLDTAANEDSTSIGAHPSDVSIGNLVGGGDTFIGRIDEATVWTRALSGGEIAALYASTQPL